MQGTRLFVILEVPHQLIELPDRFERAFGVSAAETVVIGDTTFDMEMAVNAGVDAIGVSWGYHERERLVEAGARAILKTMRDLTPVLCSLDRERFSP